MTETETIGTLACGHPCKQCTAKEKQRQTRRRWTLDQKRAMVAQAKGSSVSSTARVLNIAPRLLFKWKKDLT